MKNLDIIKNKIHTVESIQSLLHVWRFKEQKIVFTNGCFDILHQGHVDYLAKAADLGNVLIIGVNTDQSVRTIKNPDRPINDEYSRALLLASMHFTSAIILFDEETPYNLISAIMPDVLVKGADYKVENIVGADLVLANGGRVETIVFLPGFSTTGIINKIKNS